MRILAALAFLAGCTSTLRWDPDHVASAIRSWHGQTDPEPLVRVEPISIPGRPDFVAAICEYQEGWSGYFGVFHFLHGGVDREISPDIAPTEQSIYKLRVLHVPGFNSPLIEVFGLTHMGNGYLYLYSFQETRLTLLLQTRAVDLNPDPLQFHEGILSTTYRDLNGDGFPDVGLTGTIEDWGEKGASLRGSHPCRRAFLWNRTKGQFIEDASRREGFESAD